MMILVAAAICDCEALGTIETGDVEKKLVEMKGLNEMEFNLTAIINYAYPVATFTLLKWMVL